MNLEQKEVQQFHETFNIHIAHKPTIPSEDITVRRVNLITEELLELRDAMKNGDIVEIADGIADLLYVVYGTAVECGLDMEPIFAEVHRSNMTKIGGHFNEYKKLVKPPTYDPPHLLPLIEAQSK